MSSGKRGIGTGPRNESGATEPGLEESSPTIRQSCDSVSARADCMPTSHFSCSVQCRYTERDNGKRGVELYSEVDDSSESHNLAEDPKRQKVVADMRHLLRRVRGQ
jgi:hypothetical protein